MFHLRPDLEFSDGSPLTAADVVGSWLRIIDPNSPAPLAALMLDVKGARDHITGRETDPSKVGLKADGSDVEVELEGPGSDFPAIVSSPLFGIVPPAAWREHRNAFGKGAVVSGGYAVDDITDKEIVLTRNERYWAGSPAIPTVRLVTDIDGRNPIAAFTAGDLDWAEVSTLDAPWIPYDQDLGPQLRQTSSLSLTYMGFDTSRAPFNDVRVRQAFGAAVDWDRVVRLGGTTGTIPAISMVPPGIPGAGTSNWLPVHDPDKARQLLADAGYPNGAGLPMIQFAAGGLGIASGIQADLERELGVKVEIDLLDSAQQRLNADPPAMWATGWIADYLGPNDFLGVILGTDANDNYGRWSSPAFDQAVARRAGDAGSRRRAGGIRTRPCRDPARRPGRAAVPRDRLRAVARRPARRRQQRPRDPPDGGHGVGAVSGASRLRRGGSRVHRAGAALGVAILLALVAAPSAAAADPTFQGADLDGQVRNIGDVPAAGDAARGRRPRRGDRPRGRGRAHASLRRFP